jgi:hypothetical protein
VQFRSTEPNTVHVDGLADQIAARLYYRIGRQVLDLKIVSHQDGLILQGRVSTYYGKQVAQHVAMEISGRSIVANEIEVL